MLNAEKNNAFQEQNVERAFMITFLEILDENLEYGNIFGQSLSKHFVFNGKKVENMKWTK